MAVYFIQAGESGRIKIGHAKNPRRRISALQSGSHEKLFLVALSDGGKAEESALHERFASLRGLGEWFTPDASLRAMIEDHRIPAVPEKKRGRAPKEGAPGRRFPEWMRAAGHDDATLAIVAGTNRSNISRIRRGLNRPSWDLALRLCQISGHAVSLDDFVLLASSGSVA